MPRVIRKGKNLAGTCGIPAMGERLYLDVVHDCDPDGGNPSPREITLPDGRACKVESIIFRHEYGRAIFGNLVTCFEVSIRHGSMAIWHDATGWFVRSDSRTPVRTD